MQRAFIALLLFVSQLAGAQVTEVIATVDKNPAMADESITLTVVANGDVDRDAFDPSPLLKDFVVGRTSVSSQTKMVNFNTTRTTTWNTILIPRKEGRYVIPAFNVAGQRTDPINMMVVPVSANQAAQRRDVFITTEVDSDEVYLQQQIKYTVKLHLAQDLQRGSLSEPEMANAEVRQVSKDAEYSDIINGQRYRIIERVFAIIPQQSGSFNITGPLFEGEVLENRRQSFGFFNRTKTISRVGPAQSVTVLPIPAGISNEWLPSEFVQLNEEWQPGADYRVGEPITRTLTLTAVGLVEEQLPEIGSEYPPMVKTYPDQADTATVDRDGTLVAQRVESIAIVPAQPGIMVIPEVKVPWFNINTRQTEFATLPARSIEVMPVAADQSAVITGSPAVTSPIGSDVVPTSQPDVAQPFPLQTITPSWWSLSSWVLLVVWLVTLVLWWRQSRNNAQEQDEHQEASTDQLWKSLHTALKTNDPAQIYAPLTQWLASFVGDSTLALPSSQRKVASPALDAALRDMFTMQYATDKQAWSHQALLKILEALRKTPHNLRVKGVSLKPLYPQTTP